MNNNSQYKLDHVDLKLRTVTPEESPLQLHRLTNPIDVTMQVNAMNNSTNNNTNNSSNNGELYSIEVRLEKLMNHQWIDCNPNPTKGNEIRPLFKDISIQMTVNNGLKSRVIIPSHVSPKDGQFLYFQIPAMPSSSSPTTTTTTATTTTTTANNNNNARHNLTFELVIKMNTSKEKQGYKRGQDAIFRFSFQLMKHDTRTSMMTRVNQVNSFHFGIINHGKTNKAAKMYAGKGTSSTNTTTTNDNSSNLLSASPLSSSSSPSPSPSPLHQQQYLTSGGTSGGQLRKSPSNTSMTSTTPTNASHNQDASPTGSISSPIHYNINSSNMNVSGQSPMMYQQPQQVNQSSSPSNAFSSLCDLDPVSLMTFLQSNPQFQQQLMEFANEKNGYKDLAESIKLLTVFDQRQQQQQQQQNGGSVFFQSMNNNNANNGSQVSPCPSSASSFASSGSSTDSAGEMLKFEDLFSSGGVNGDLDWNMDDIDCFDSMMEEGDLLGSDDILTLADDFKLDEIFSVPRGSDQQQKQQQQQLQQQQMQQLQFQQQQQMAWYAQQQQAMLMQQQQQQNMMGLTGQQQQQTMSGGFYDLLTNNSQNVMLNGFATVQQQQQYLQAMQQQQLLLAQQQQQMQWNNPNAFIPQQQQQQQRQAGVQYVPNTRNMYNAHMSMSSYEEEEEDEMIKSDLIMAPSRTRTIAINAQSAYSEEETEEKPIDMSQFNFGNKKPVSIHQSYSMMESDSVTVTQSLKAKKEESMLEKRKKMASPKMLRSESVSAYSPKPSAAPSVTSSSRSLRMSVTSTVSSGKGGAAPPAVRMSHAPAPAPSMFAAVESADLFEELTQSPVFKIASFDLSPAPPAAAPALPVREEEEAEEHLLEGISKMSLRNNNTSNKRIISFKARNLNQPQNEKIRFIRRGKSKVPVFEIGESIQFTVGPLDVNNKLEAMIYLSNMPNKTMLEFDGVDSRLTNTLFTQLNKDGQTATLDTKQLKQSKRLIVLSLFIKMHAHDSQKSQVAIVNKPILLVPKGTMSK